MLLKPVKGKKIESFCIAACKNCGKRAQKFAGRCGMALRGQVIQGFKTTREKSCYNS